MSKDIEKKIRQTFLDSISVKKEIVDNDLDFVLLEAGKVIADSIANGGKLLICGNGGSAADAQHLAAEFLIRLTSDINRGSIPALSLAQDTSTLTACINDYGADSVRLFILSDSPPEKDVQWSDEGIISAYKFIQKLWVLNNNILQEMLNDNKQDSSQKLQKFTNQLI